MIRWLIVGLGNPGKKYEVTKHNIGFMAIDYITNVWNTHAIKTKANALAVESTDEEALLVKPQTYMNDSGEAVLKLVQFYKLPHQNMIVIYDDLSLNVGTVRIKIGGSSGGHNGIRSIDHYIKDPYIKIKVGIGHPRDLGLQQDPASYVLHPLVDAHQKILTEQMKAIEQIIRLILQGKINQAMNQYHTKGT
jgi:PTH1 family peptidyl-tRNA hydrolase